MLSASSASASHYPIACLRCRRVAAKPLAVSTITTKSSFIVELACSACHHRWAEEVARGDAI